MEFEGEDEVLVRCRRLIEPVSGFIRAQRRWRPHPHNQQVRLLCMRRHDICFADGDDIHAASRFVFYVCVLCSSRHDVCMADGDDVHATSRCVLHAVVQYSNCIHKTSSYYDYFA